VKLVDRKLNAHAQLISKSNPRNSPSFPSGWRPGSTVSGGYNSRPGSSLGTILERPILEHSIFQVRLRIRFINSSSNLAVTKALTLTLI